jgi:hypothetical protein
MCSCEFTEFQVIVEDEIIIICCVQCDITYLPEELAKLPDTLEKQKHSHWTAQGFWCG